MAVLASIETFHGTKIEFEAWTESTKNAAQITGQNAIYIVFSKLTGSPLSTANSLKIISPSLIWMDPKQELSLQCSFIPYDTHTTQVFACLEQGLNEILGDFLHCVSDLLFNICNTSDMSSISVDSTNYYAVVYGLNCRKLKNSIMGH